MRTEEFRVFDTKLSTINRNFSHGLFLSEQFLIDNAQLIANNAEALSKDVYTSNPYREKFNYRLKYIPEEITEYRKTTFISFYVFVYSAFELYTEGLATLVDQILPTGLKKPKKVSTLEAIFLSIGTTISTYLSQDELDTLDYIRLRRNCLVHADGKPSTQLLLLIRTKGHQLNTYWRGTKRKMNIVDFSSVHIEQFHEREIIDTIRILRDIARKIDENVLNVLRIEDIIKYILRDFQRDFANDIKGKPRGRIESKFANVARIRFNIAKKDINFTTLVF